MTGRLQEKGGGGNEKSSPRGLLLEFGAGNRSRTYDLRITNALLYQLSYAGKTICFDSCVPVLNSAMLKLQAKHLCSSQFAALFMGPDLERPKSYQSFFEMGNKRPKINKKNRDLHALKI